MTIVSPHALGWVAIELAAQLAALSAARAADTPPAAKASVADVIRRRQPRTGARSTRNIPCIWSCRPVG